MANKKGKKLDVNEFDFPIQPAKILYSAEEILQDVKLNLKCKTNGQKTLVKQIKEKEIVICSGPAGTGKTYVTCAEALSLIKGNTPYKKIVIVKSVTTLKDEEVGFLKGTLKDKMEPCVYSFIHNFEKLIGKYTTEKLRESDIIEELPIAYMRGINIDDAIVIIDEVQNITIENIRTILTRLGQNSKMIFIGDEKQIDMRNPKKSALKFLLDNFSELDEIGTLRLGKEDIVRNPLIIKIEDIFDNILN